MISGSANIFLLSGRKPQ